MRLFEIDPRQLRRFDLWLTVLMFGLSLAGALAIWGSYGQEVLSASAKRQLVWIALGAGVFLVCCFLDLKTVEWAGYPLYGLCLLLLAGLFFWGRQIEGARSWYKMGSIHFQPSELMKIAVVVVLASHLSRCRSQLRHARGLLIPAAIAGVPCLLTMMQNDSGTAIVFVPIFMIMIYMAGAQKRVLGALVVVALLGGAIALPRMHPYQLARISAVLGKRFSDQVMPALGQNPEEIWQIAERRSKFHSEQARIALGSGQIVGKGWGQGTQTRLKWLPQFHTDFIYASLGEQFGFVGCALLALAYAVMVWRGARIALEARDMFSSLMVVGLLTIFVAHVILNLGMAVDLLPIIGLPLPFLSYGGSFLLALFALFGLVVNVGMRKFLY